MDEAVGGVAFAIGVVAVIAAAAAVAFTTAEYVGVCGATETGTEIETMSSSSSSPSSVNGGHTFP